MSKNTTIRALVPWNSSRGLHKEKLSPQILELLNLSFEPFDNWTLVKFQGQKLGERCPNGSWDGLIGGLADGKGDPVSKSEHV